MQNVEKSASARGGARPGAGRKKGTNSRNIRVAFTLSPEAVARLAAAAESQGTSRNDLVNRLLEALGPES